LLKKTKIGDWIYLDATAGILKPKLVIVVAVKMLLLIVMASSNAGLAYGNYYLQIQALSESKELGGTTVVTAPTAAEAVSLPVLPVSLVLAVVLVLLAAIADFHYKSHKIIRTAIRLALLVVMIPIGLSVIANPLSLISKAGPDQIPRNVVVDKVNANSFQMTWETRSGTASVVKLWPRDLDNPTKVLVESIKPTNKHQILIEELQPAATYQFKILSDGVWYDNNGSPIEVTTSEK